ncbi:uncharacterized protein LOC144136534 [Amblyomma americanum]|uniref:Secreted protein n=1 Tax=Amblyomma americanum TaxID=6943 RepID=A0AAQ4FB08_AMBAM
MWPRSVSELLIGALPVAAAVVLLQSASHQCGVRATAIEVEDSTVQKTSRHLGLAPFNLGINIPYIFNMKLLTGPTSTGLGLSVPAIFNMQLDTGGPHLLARPTGLRLNFFGAGRNGDGKTRRRRPSIFRPAEYDQVIDARTTQSSPSS